MNGPGERLRGEIAAVVELLESAEIAAATEPADVNVTDGGGAWVTVVALRPKTLGGAWEADVAVYLIARDAGVDEAWADLGDLLDAFLTVAAPDGEITTEAVQLPGTTALPALRVPLTIDF